MSFPMTEKTSPLLGLLCAVMIVLIWSGFILVSRMGALSPLSIYDMAALRFGFAGFLLLPATWLWWPRRLNLTQILLLSAGTGAPYVLLAYAGFSFAPVSHGGVFINGILPIFTTLISIIWLGLRPPRTVYVAICIILLGCSLTAFAKGGVGSSSSWIGDLLFSLAALIMAAYMPATKAWKITLKELLSFVPFVNALIFLPLWYFFLPSHLDEASLNDIFLQMLYQGLGPSIFGLIFFFLAIKHLGATPTACVLALVPSLASLMGIPILGDIPHILEWIGMGLVCLGILLSLKSKEALK